jgi:hypothetical protein
MNLNELTSVKSAQPPFPLNFSVATADDSDLSPVLYIENIDNAHDLHWSIMNEGTEELFIEPVTTPPSIDNFQFQLRLRPGTLSQHFISKGKPVFRTNRSDATWDISVTEDSTSKIVYISLVATTIPAGKLTFAPNVPFEVIIEKVNADPVGGARNTNVEFVYKSIYNSASNTLNGNRMQHMGIVNHQGMKNIPLLVETLGSAIILNTGARNDLSVQISNYSRNKLPLMHEATRKSTFEIIIYAPVGDESGELFLAPIDKLKEIVLDWKAAESWNAGSRVENPDSVSWTITNERMDDIGIGQSLNFDLNNIVTTLPEGVTNIQINYFNFPGYFDGALHLDLLKSPVNFKNKNVGVHTNDPKHLLDVRGEGGFHKLVITGEDGTAYPNNGIGMDKTLGDNQEYLRINGIAGADQTTRLAIAADMTRIMCKLLDVKGHFHVQDGDNNSVIYGPPKASGQFYFRSGDEADHAELMQISGAGVVTAKAFNDEHGPVVPKGVIVAWYGDKNNVPPGWTLCNGDNGTPDLQERFIYGTGNRGPAPRTPGGSSSKTLKVDQLPAHSHNIDFAMADVAAAWTGNSYWPVNPSHRNNGSWTKSTNNTGSGNAFDIMPPYLALCYIMKL